MFDWPCACVCVCVYAGNWHFKYAANNRMPTKQLHAYTYIFITAYMCICICICAYVFKQPHKLCRPNCLVHIESQHQIALCRRVRLRGLLLLLLVFTFPFPFLMDLFYFTCSIYFICSFRYISFFGPALSIYAFTLVITDATPG